MKMQQICFITFASKLMIFTIQRHVHCSFLVLGYDVKFNYSG
jgi:hypothetical protein